MGGLEATAHNGEEEEAVKDARRFGMNEAAIAELKVALGRPAFGFGGVWPVNVPIVDAFCAVGSQWRTTIVAAGGALVTRFLGLDYAGVRASLEALGTGITPDLWRGLQVMEGVARDALNGGG